MKIPQPTRPRFHRIIRVSNFPSHPREIPNTGGHTHHKTLAIKHHVRRNVHHHKHETGHDNEIVFRTCGVHSGVITGVLEHARAGWFCKNVTKMFENGKNG